MECTPTVEFITRHLDELSIDKLLSRVNNILDMVERVNSEDLPIENRLETLKELLLKDSTLHYDVEHFREFFETEKESMGKCSLDIHECDFSKNEPIITFEVYLHGCQMVANIEVKRYFSMKICGENTLFDVDELEVAKKMVSGEYKNFLNFCVTSKKYEQLKEFEDKLGRLCALYGVYIGDVAEMCWTTDDELKTVEYRYTDRKGSPCIEVVEVVEKDGTQIL